MPIGILNNDDCYVAAEQCVNLVNGLMREHLVRTLRVGCDLRDYILRGYGGGGGSVHLPGCAGVVS